MRATHAGSWRSGRTPPTSTTGTGEGQRARPRERYGPARGAGPWNLGRNKTRADSALPGDGGGFFLWQGSVVPGLSTHHHLPLFQCLEGKRATWRAAPRGGVSEIREHNPRGRCIQPEQGHASHTWPEESVRPKSAWIVLGDRCVRLGASGLEFLFCGLRVRFRVSRREPPPQSRGQRFGTCSVGAQEHSDAEDAMASHPELFIWLCCNSQDYPGCRAITVL